MQTIAKTTSGEVEGVVKGGVVAFKGIPFAAPPFGANRLGPPARPAPWEGVRPATAYGATVPKPRYPVPFDQLLPEPVIPGPDCLNLNVWTADPGRSGMPVLVWIHGGAFVNGSGAVAQYAGNAFARDGVVCVTINYRLGAEGFLLLDDGTPNLGLLDQLAALAWVQENIAAFGGDPSNVTIAGESAGAMSVSTLLSMPRAAGLFRRVIAQSGAGSHVLSTGTARRVTAELARRLGVAPTREGVGSVPVERLVTEQAQLSAEIALLPDPATWGEIALNMMAFEPVVDGDVLPVVPLDGVRGGQGHGVDLMIGTNADEQLLFLVPTGILDLLDDATAAYLIGQYGPGVLDRYRQLRPDARVVDLVADISTDWSFRIPAIRLAEAHLPGEGSTHMYEFAWRSPLLDGRLGACHALEIGFVFDTLDADMGEQLYGPAAPRSLATTMHRAWVDYASSGDPGWEPYDRERRPTMVFDLESAVVDDPEADRRALWDGFR